MKDRPFSPKKNKVKNMKIINRNIMNALKIMMGLICLLIAMPIFAQEVGEGQQDYGVNGELQDVIELLIQENEELANNDTFLESLQDFYDNKPNINKATVDDLMPLIELGLLTEKQIVELIKYRENVGKIINKYELQAIPKWDLATIRKVIPFVRVKGGITDFNMPIPQLLFGGKHEFYLRYSRVLEEQAGYIPDTLADGTIEPIYLGSQEKIYARYRHKQTKKLSYGVTGEKDAGEQFFRGYQKQGFDFYSAHLYVKDLGPLKHLAIGDYEIKIGQGLMVWNGIAFGKSPYVMNIKRQGPSVKPYTSVNEYNFFRGVATTVGIGKKMELTAFGSYKPIDINFQTMDTIGNTILTEVTGDDGFISAAAAGSLQQTGMHRTLSEVLDKNTSKQTNVGADFVYQNSKMEVGIAGLYTNFKDVYARQDRPYNIFHFSGQNLLNASVHYRYLLGNIHLFGETAISDNRDGQVGWGTVNGALISMHPTIDVSLLYRNFSKDYQSLFAQPFSESSTPINESGFFIGTEIRPVKKWLIQAYTDVYTHRWLKFRTDAPSYGHDKMVQVTYKPSRELSMYVRYNTETKGRNFSQGDAETDFELDDLSDVVIDAKLSRTRFNLRYKLHKDLVLKSHVQISSFEDGVKPRERGYLVFQEISWKKFGFPISVDIRYSLFDTDSWDTRIYTYEKDVLYAFSIPPFANRGRRFYTVLRWNATRNLTFWGRFARTTYDNLNYISPGNTEGINGNKKSEVKLQMRMKF